MAAKQPPPTGGAPERPSSELSKAFGAAVGHHKAGKLQEAEQAYRGILEQQPGQPDTLNMLGVVAGQRGQSDRAIDWFRQAVRADGKNPTFHYNLAKAQHATGDLGGCVDLPGCRVGLAVGQLPGTASLRRRVEHARG